LLAAPAGLERAIRHATNRIQSTSWRRKDSCPVSALRPSYELSNPD
jgi:hypothetical protein